MWIMTSLGFFSIVQKPSDKAADTLTVRARVRGDLDALRKAVLPTLSATLESRTTDYWFRATAPRAEVQAALSNLVAELHYENYKDQVSKTQGLKRSRLYHDVWSVLNRMQGDPTFEVQGRKGGRA